MKKGTFIFSFSLLLIVLIFINNNCTPYEKILACDMDNGKAIKLMKHYKSSLNDSEMDSLLKKLIVDNMDVYTINLTAYFIRDWQKCEYLQHMDDKCILLKSFPMDSVWYVNYRDDGQRGSNRRMAEMKNGIFEHVEKMKIECNYNR